MRIYSSLNKFDVYNVRNFLESRGVPCEIRGEHLANLVGMIPIPDAMLEIWLLDESQAAQAKKILAESETSQSSPWTCSKCGESIEGQFSECWKCRASRPASD